MSRKSFKEINPFQATQTISSEEQERPFDWSLCILCQSITKESLQCPARSKRLDLGDAIRKACEQDYDSEALHLARAAKIIRRDMFSMQQSFKGTFEIDCHAEEIGTTISARPCQYDY